MVPLLPPGSGPFGTNSLFSCRATVHIQVNDMNEYSPVFKEKSYKATVIEGKAYDSILKVEAVDADCSFQFSQICSYEIVTPDVPFTIDKDGKMREVWHVLGQKHSLFLEHRIAVSCNAAVNVVVFLLLKVNLD